MMATAAIRGGRCCGSGGTIAGQSGCWCPSGTSVASIGAVAAGHSLNSGPELSDWRSMKPTRPDSNPISASGVVSSGPHRPLNRDAPIASRVSYIKSSVPLAVEYLRVAVWVVIRSAARRATEANVTNVVKDGAATTRARRGVKHRGVKRALIHSGWRRTTMADVDGFEAATTRFERSLLHRLLPA